MRKFLLECRRRKVFQVAALYVVGAWVMLQVADLAFEAWELPSGMLRQVWIAAFLGFPVALVFGWRYDISGGRIVRTPAAGESAELSLRRADYFVLASLVLVIGTMIVIVAANISSVSPTSDERRAAVDVDPRSIAVLPFAVVGAEDERTDVLAMGVQDDLLTRLSKIAALKVISRTSVERFRGATDNVSEIAGELGVARVLEGSILSAGDQIRINVQLIDGSTDEHIWAENYDRSLSAANIFDIQSEIVEEIARQLHANLTQRESDTLGEMPTQNLEAYTAYLRGKQLSEAESMEALYPAIASFEQAVSLDPDFALAYVGIADAWLTLATRFSGGISDAEGNAKAEPPLAKALALEPDLGQAYATQGLLRLQQGNREAARQAFERAIELQPNYPRVFRLYAALRQMQGDTDGAMRLLHRALELDPYSAPVNFDLARLHDDLGEFDKALAGYLRVIEIEPGHAFAHVYIAGLKYTVFGKVDEALIWYHKAAENDELSPSLRSGQAFAYMELGDLESASKWVDEAVAMDPDSFWPLWASLLFNLRTSNEEAALRDARALLEAEPRNVAALNVLRKADLKAGRLEAALSRYGRAYRELTEPDSPAVDEYNYLAAVDLALVYLGLDDRQRAEQLLNQSLEIVAAKPRHGIVGYWLTDVYIHALRGNTRAALDALEQAIDEGWRYNAWYFLEYHPNAESLRALPEFQALYAEVKADLATQARRVRELQASGEL